MSETLSSNLLKSNCLVTNQPDWGSVVIRYEGRKIDRESLLRYLISLPPAQRIPRAVRRAYFQRHQAKLPSGKTQRVRALHPAAAAWISTPSAAISKRRRRSAA